MRKLPPYLLLLSGGILMATLLLANPLGLSHQTRWGTVRMMAFGLGALLALAGLALITYHSRFLSEAARNRLRRAVDLPARWVRRAAVSPRLGLGFALTMLVLSGAVTVWYASIGLFPAFPKIKNLYITQADAFLHGQVSLLETPPTALAALQNPYDLTARQDIPYLWDASYFQGKYYLYWGPVPALFFAALMAVTGSQPQPQLGVILPALGLTAVLLYLLWQIRRRAYPRAPALFIGLFLLAAAVNMPMLFLLDRGRIYETSILTGQFLLFLGTASWLAYTLHEKRGWLVLAGLSWGLAVSTRYNLALSVLIYLAFCLPLLWKTSLERDQRIKRLTALLAPLVICGLGTLLYNALRFGSPLETGLRYQLTNMVDHNGHFSSVYFLPNVYLYFLFPQIKVGLFPVIRSIFDVAGQAPAWAAFPADKLNDEVIFSLRTVPLTWLLGLLAPLMGAVWLVSRGKRRLAEAHPSPDWSQRYWPPLAWMIGLGGLAQLALLLVYYFTAVRFMVDFILPWLLCILFLLWELDHRLAPRLWPLRWLIWGGVALMIVWTAGTGFFAGIDNPPRPFHLYNPALESALASAWNQLYTRPGVLGALLRGAVALIP